jgi:hypothetical protein
MRVFLFTVLAFALTGCGAMAPAAAKTSSPTDTPVVVVQTVLVTVVPTEMPTDIPTGTLAPTSTPEVIVVTATPSAGGTTSPAGPTSTNPTLAGPTVPGPTATMPADWGGGIFTSTTRSSDHFALNCEPKSITFTVSTDNFYVTGVDIYYRIEDRLSVSISQWNWGGNMVGDKHGNFTMDFASTRVDKDLRSHRAWFDYQFVGLNKNGQAVGRSLRIVKQITYNIDCVDY